MKIPFNRIWPTVWIVFGTTFGILNLLYPMHNSKDVLWLAPMIVILSIPTLFANYIIISDREIIVNNQFGMVRRRYAINSMDEISMKGNRIFINKPNKREEIKFSKMLVSKAGLNALKSQVNILE
ncbi:MAG TPA: hypothetical protein VD905_21430 [Flavobacteriales bacterium]|nr:hypothetical protein [Flavobacteriales bacterium]